MRTLHTHVRQGRAQKERPEHAPLEGREDGGGICCCPWGGQGDFLGRSRGVDSSRCHSHRMRMQHTPGRDTSALKGRLRQEHTDPKRSLKAGTGPKGRTPVQLLLSLGVALGFFGEALGSGQQQLHVACSTCTMRTMQVAPGNKLRAELP